MSCSVTLVGHSCLDCVQRSDGNVHLRAGGVPLYAGATFVRLGRPCRIFTKYDLGDDIVTSALKTAGVNVNACSSAHSTTFDFAESDGEIGEPCLVTEGDPIVGSDLDFAQSRAVYFAPLTPRDIELDCYQSARNAGGTIFLDAQGITRQEPSASNRRAAYRILSFVDVVKVTSAEALWLFGTDKAEDLQTAFRELGIEEVVLTAGSKGSAVIWAAQITIIEERAIPAADKVGCGDVYFASFVDARLRGHSPASSGGYASEFVARWLQKKNDDASRH